MRGETTAGGWWRRRLERPGATGGVVALGLLLCAPSLGNGLALDDVLHAVGVADGHDAGTLFELFGGPAPLVADADTPWWRHGSMRLALLRPLASLTHIFDYTYLRAHPVWMHVHSLVWYGVLLIVAARVYARLLPARWVGVLAALLYAVDHTHGMVVGWLAARSGLVGAALALLCLWAHDRWRRDGWRAGAVLGPFALVVALLANEGAVGICGFLMAHALCLERGRARARVLALVPAAAVVLVWRGWYVAAGAGAAHSGFYFDPGVDPVGHGVRSLGFGVVLVVSEAFVSLGELLGMVPGLYFIGALASAVVLGLLAAVFRMQLRACAELRFWAVGTLLAALPLGSTLPTDRQLMLVGFGVFGLAARLVYELQATGDERRGVGWFGRGWFALHLVVSPLLLPLRSQAPAQVHAVAEAAANVYIEDASARRVFLMRVPSDLLMLYPRAQARLAARAFPDEWQYLYAGLGALEVTRIDADTLELRPALGWLYAPLDRLYRDERDEFVAGQRIVARSASIEVREVTPDTGRPLVVRVQIDGLAAPGTRWYSWEAGGPAALELPQVGQTRTLPAMANPLLSP